jgi:MFS family permease
MPVAGPSDRASYRSLVRAAGPRYLVTSFFGRLPAAMAPLGLILLVAASTGSYAKAGAATAALGIGAAAGGPIVGAMSDRFGQRSVGLGTALANAVALAATAVAVLSGAGVTTVLGFAALAGLSTPQVGPFARVRWVRLLGRRQASLSTAMSYEGAVDEASYVAGPALIGVLALTGMPWLPLAVATGLAALASVAFALHPTAAPAGTPSRCGPAVPSHRRVRRPVAQVLPFRRLAPLIAAMAGLGVVFGATQTGVAAYATSAGRPGIAGLVYAVLGVGSALSGFATAYLPARLTPARRLPIVTVALFVGSLPLLLVSSTGAATVAMALLGVTAAPVLVTVYARAEQISPAARVGAVMTLLASGTVGGVALGAAVAGSLAQSYGFDGAFAVSIAAAALTALLGARSALAGRPARGSQVAVGAADDQPERRDASHDQDGRRRSEELVAMYQIDETRP